MQWLKKRAAAVYAALVSLKTDAHILPSAQEKNISLASKRS